MFLISVAAEVLRSFTSGKVTMSHFTNTSASKILLKRKVSSAKCYQKYLFVIYILSDTVVITDA